MRPSKEPLPTLEPGVYKLANPTANPFPKKTKWLSSLHVFPAGEYMCLPPAPPFPRRKGLLGAKLCMKGYRGFICANSRAAFKAIAAKLEYVRPLGPRPSAGFKRGPKPKEYNFPIDQFLESIAGKELSSNGIRFAAQDFDAGRTGSASHWQLYKSNGLLSRLKARMEHCEWSETWTYKNKQLTSTD